VGAGGGAGAAAQQGGQAAGDGGLTQLRANEMHMRVDAAGSGGEIFAGDDFGAVSEHQLRSNGRLNERVGGLGDADVAAGANAAVSFDDAAVVQDYSIGDDEIQGRFGFAFLGIGYR